MISKAYFTSPRKAWTYVKYAVAIHTLTAFIFSFLSFGIEFIVFWLYKGKYTEAKWIFYLLLPLPFLTAISNGLEAWNRAANLPKVVAQSYALASGITIGIILPALHIAGVYGAAAVILVAKIVLVLGLYIWRKK